MSMLILCSASWYILRRTENVQPVSAPENDTLEDYFSVGGIYNGETQQPVITSDGKDALSIDEGDYTVTLKESSYATAIESGESSWAGTHKYEIFDKTTDQYICYSHIVTIEQDTLKTYIDNEEKAEKNYGDRFEGEEIPISIEWEADNSDISAAPNVTTIDVSDSHFHFENGVLSAHNIDYKPVNFNSGINSNNYSNYSNSIAKLSFTVLPKAQISSTYYASIEPALNEAASGDTVIALQSYGTYVSHPSKNSAENGTFTHVIDQNVTIKSGVTLKIPNGIDANATSITVTKDTSKFTYGRTDDKSKDGLFLIYNETGSLKIDSDAYFRNEWCKNVVNIKGSTLTNYGTIIIDAVVTGGAGGAPYNSIVFGDYSKMTLDSNSKIINTGTINCYGFIDEETPTDYNPDLVISDKENINNVQLDMQSGTLNTIFTIVEHRGGNMFMGMVNPDADELMKKAKWKADGQPDEPEPYSPALTTFAFHRFFIQSVSVNTMISGTASVSGEVTLYANDGPNQTVLQFMGNSAKNPIFAIASNSYATLKYTHAKEDNATSRKMDIDVYGDASVNPMSISLKINKIMTAAALEAKLGSLWGVANLILGVKDYLHIVIAVEMNSNSSLLPISHYYDLAFHKNGSTAATVDMTQQGIKILPGGSVLIDEGVTVNASKIAVYKNNYLLNGLPYATEKANISAISPTIPTTSPADGKDTGIAQGEPYPDSFNNVGGKLTIGGTLNVVNLGGKVIADSNNAILIISGAHSVVSKELLASYKETLNLGIAGYTIHSQNYNASCFSTDADSKLTATGDLWSSANGDFTITKEQPLSANVEYHGVDGAWEYQQDIIINRYDNGANNSPTTFSVSAWTKSGLTFTAEHLPTDLQRDHYESYKWSTSKTSIVSPPTTIYTTQSPYSVYAKWTPISYNITLDYRYVDVSSLTDVKLPSSMTYTIDDKTVALPNLPDDLTGQTVPDTHKFAGWYLDDGTYANNVDGISGANLIAQTNGNCTLYGLWAAEVYEFHYDLGNTVQEGEYDASALTPLNKNYFSDTLKLYADDKEDTKYKYYLTGWQLVDKDANAIKDENGNDVIFAPGTVLSTFVDKYSAPYYLKAVWGTKYKLNVEGNSNSDGKINNTNFTIDFAEYLADENEGKPFYLLDSQIDTYLTAIADYATQYDDITGVNKYFKNWTENGTVIELTAGAFGGDKELTVTASFDDKYEVVCNANGGTCTDFSGWYNPQQSITLPTPDRTGYTFLGWYDATEGGNKIGDAGGSYSPSANITLYAQWTKTPYTITVSTSNATVSGVSNGQTAYYGDSFSVTVSFSKKYSLTFTVKDASGNTILEKSAAGTYSFTMPAGNVTISASSSSCLIEGTLITLADGTQKKVEDLTMNDMLLVFNHETGKVEPGMIIMLDHLDVPRQMYRVLNLEFSNGEILRVIDGHGVFDYTLKQYVFITEENMNDYIGHEFYSTYYNGTEFVSETVTMTNAFVTEEFTKIYCPLTAVHMNFYASGLLNFTPTPHSITTGHTNIFELDENLKYDEEKKQADIEKYGLFTYEDLSEYLTEEQFNALPFAYFKVSIGKGLMTWEEMIYCIEYVMGSASS